MAKKHTGRRKLYRSPEELKQVAEADEIWRSWDRRGVAFLAELEAEMGRVGFPEVEKFYGIRHGDLSPHDVICELASAVVRWRNPKRVKNVRAYESEQLRYAGLMYILERDTAVDDDYLLFYQDVVSDFSSVERGGGVGSDFIFDYLPQDADGAELCDWVDSNFDDDGTLLPGVVLGVEA
jgi:hypothetical protein